LTNAINKKLLANNLKPYIAYNIFQYYFMKILAATIILTLAFIINASQLQAQQKISNADLDSLSKYMSGIFNNTVQANADANFYNMQMHVKPIWKDAINAKWFYVEQCLAQTPKKPYRQRIYKITVNNDTSIISKTYLLNGKEEKYINAFDDNKILEQINTDSLSERTGCSIYFIKNKSNEFVGKTNKQDCESNLRGAAYTTSSVIISSNAMSNWDCGFDKENNLVWGNKFGGYKFVKIKNY